MLLQSKWTDGNERETPQEQEQEHTSRIPLRLRKPNWKRRSCIVFWRAEAKHMLGDNRSIEPTKRSRTHSPSFESVLALAPNGAAAKNRTTTPMAAPAMSAPDCGFSSSSPPNPPPSCLPFTAAPFLCRLQETDQLIWQEKKKRGVSFLVPLFLYASIAAFLSLVSAS